MDTSTTIRRMMAGNKIVVPTYQRAYSWDTPIDASDKNTQTDVFLSDLEEYRQSGASSPYYFGHFLFEEREQMFYVIDGQQRLTTTVIFLAALFIRLKEIKAELSDEEMDCYDDMIKRRSTIHFTTVEYDNQLFNDYVIEQTKTDHNGLETESSKRIVNAFDFFKRHFSKKEEDYLTDMLSIVAKAICTTHIVENESEAIQMFIFQNSRGKRVSNLEVIKAQFMYYVHLRGEHQTGTLVNEIKNRFEKIYKSISLIEYRINEDDILLYTLRVYFNSLLSREANALDKINKMLAEPDPTDFIKDFTHLLSDSFEYLSQFFGQDERNNFAIHSLITLGGIGVAFPFIIKSYRYGLSLDDRGKLCASLESLLLRHRLIRTRAEITSRINDVFEEFTEKNSNISPILEHVEKMKTDIYWNNEKLKEALQGEIRPPVAKFLLWKYETLLEQKGKSGYKPTRFDQIEKPELEHIAPRTEPDSTRRHGYGIYNQKFKDEFLDCLGNYLLVSKSHNCAVGNIPFSKKLVTYTHNEQQREIKTFLVRSSNKWNRTTIGKRKAKIIETIMNNC